MVIRICVIIRFKIGITFAIFNLEGNVPRSIDLLRIFGDVTYNIACMFKYADKARVKSI